MLQRKLAALHPTRSRAISRVTSTGPRRAGRTVRVMASFKGPRSESGHERSYAPRQTRELHLPGSLRQNCTCAGTPWTVFAHQADTCPSVGAAAQLCCSMPGSTWTESAHEASFEDVGRGGRFTKLPTQPASELLMRRIERRDRPRPRCPPRRCSALRSRLHISQDESGRCTVSLCSIGVPARAVESRALLALNQR